MSLCVNADSNTTAIVSDDSCTYMLLTKEELIKLTEQPSLLDLIKFDPTLYNDLLVYMLVSFVVGHMTGRVIKLLGKV